MKPLKNTISIKNLQTLIRQWKQRGLREATLLKVLELYLGLPEYMNAQGEYPVQFFYELSIALKFRTVTMMLECVKMSGSFGWKPGNNKMNMASFYSPLWMEKDKKPSEKTAEMQVLPAELHASLQ